MTSPQHLTDADRADLRRIADVLDGALADLREMRKHVTRRQLAETGPYAPLEMPCIQLNPMGQWLRRLADESEAREREAKARPRNLRLLPVSPPPPNGHAADDVAMVAAGDE